MNEVCYSVFTHFFPLDQCETLENRVFEVVRNILICAVAGVFLGMCWNVQYLSTLANGALGALIGTIFTACSSNFIHFSNPDSPAKIFLNQMEEELSEDENLLKNVQTIRAIFEKTHAHMTYSHELHAMYNKVTVITDQLKAQEGLKNIWKQFLQSAEQTTIHFYDGYKINPGFQRQISRLEDSALPEIRIQQLTPNFIDSNYLKQLQLLFYECFGLNGLNNDEAFRRWLLSNSLQHLIACEDDNIIGWLAYRYELGQGITAHICYFGRKADAAKMGVARNLFQKFLNDLGEEVPAYLEVRRSNLDAISFYEEFGFTQESVKRNYYAFPNEDGLLMARPAQPRHYGAFQ